MKTSNNFKIQDLEKALKEEGLSQKDYNEIYRRLSREPNRVELGMFGVMWSEHCCYRNSKPLLSKFPTKGTRILVGPGENAGVVDLGNNERLVFKIESHNHPSAVEPFQGAATGIGGILRDIFTMGARPIAILNALRFGPLEDQNNIALLKGVVAGISHYGNCVGVPTIGGETSFDHSYSGNPLVNAMALGLMETDEIVCSGANGIGFPVIYVGSTTGRDGMGGASFASSELTDSSVDDRPAVQVGDPFLEKGLIEACLEAFKSGDVVAAQDMGAAGLTCSCSEMASKGGLGIELNLDLVPARESDMTPYEFLLSESQERMLFVVKPGSENIVMSRFLRWGLNACVVGSVLEENIVRVLHKDEIVAELPASALADDTPINHHEILSEPPKLNQDHWKWNEEFLSKDSIHGIIPTSGKYLDLKLTWNDVLLKLLDNPNIASKNWIYNQYDRQVQLNTVLTSGDSDAAIVRIRSQLSNDSNQSFQRGIAAVVDCLNRWVFLDPNRGSMATVAESARNLSCVGAEPLAITNNLNFSSPNSNQGYWQLAEACDGISKACLSFQTPVTGGNVSLYNEIKKENGDYQPIQPTPVIGMVGLVENINNTVGQGWTSPGDEIWLLGVPFDSSSELDSRLTLAGTSYLEVIHDLVTGRPPETDFELELKVQKFVRNAISSNYLQSAHDVSEGGIAVTCCESSICSGLGANIRINFHDGRLDRALFAEGGARIVVSIDKQKSTLFQAALKDKLFANLESVPAIKLGEVIEEKKFVISLKNHNIIELDLEELVSTYNNSISDRLRMNR